MKKNRKIIAIIYSLISLLIIAAVFFLVDYFKQNKGNNVKNESASIEHSLSTTTRDDGVAQEVEIYNPYDKIDFENYKRVNIDMLNTSDVYDEDYALKLAGNSEDESFTAWDNALTQSMPLKNMFGMTDNIIVLAADDSKKSINDAINSGQYFSYSGEEEKLPVVNSIDVRYNTIEIDAEGFSTIEWITENGQVAGYGETINPYAKDVAQWNDQTDMVTKPNKYLRAAIIGENGTIYTQPIGFK